MFGPDDNTELKDDQTSGITSSSDQLAELNGMLPRIDTETQCFFMQEKGANVVEFTVIPISLAKARPDLYPGDRCMKPDQALATINAVYGPDKKGWQKVYDPQTQKVTFRKIAGEDQTYIDTSNNGSVAVDNTEIDKDSEMFDKGYAEDFARGLTTYGDMSANDSTFVSNLTPIDYTYIRKNTDGSESPSWMTAYGPNNSDGSQQMYLIMRGIPKGGNIHTTMEPITFNNDSTAVMKPLKGLQVDSSGHFIEGVSPWSNVDANMNTGSRQRIVNTTQKASLRDEYLENTKSNKQAYGGRLYSRGGRIQTRPAPNAIRAQNGLKLHKAEGMGNDEYDVYL